MNRIVIFTAGLCMTSSALAGGYRVSIQGQKALGMGHTGVAISESSEVVFFNPAGMSFLESETDITGGITLLEGKTKYQNEDTNASAETQNRTGTPINFYYSKKFDEQLAYGLGIYTPYGNNVEWPTDWQGSHLVNNIELKAVYFQPTVSYKLNDQHSLGFGLTYAYGSVEFNRNLTTSLADANGRSNVTLKESGVDDWGFNFGYLNQISDELSFGISYRSQIDLEARGGDADFENIPTSLQSIYSDTTFDADLVLPAELTLGIAYQINDQTLVAFDINRTYWSEYKSLDIKFGNSAPDSINPRDYEDSNIYRIGVQHRLDDQLTLRAGLYKDESPVPSDRYTPETARNDSLAYTAGASYAISDQMELDFSLLIVTFDEFDGTYAPQDFSGSYITSAYSFGFGLNYTF
jgi:long-chain fatty acid transport protein